MSCYDEFIIADPTHFYNTNFEILESHLSTSKKNLRTIFLLLLLTNKFLDLREYKTQKLIYTFNQSFGSHLNYIFLTTKIPSIFLRTLANLNTKFIPFPFLNSEQK